MKNCINCGKELYDQAVICPSCKAEQIVPDSTPQPNKPKRERKKLGKKQISIIKLSFTSILCLALVGVSIYFGYNLYTFKYIERNLPVWENAINVDELLTSEQLEKLYDDITKYDSNLDDFSNKAENILDKHYSLYDDINSIKKFVNLNNEYTKKQNDHSYEISQETNEQFASLYNFYFVYCLSDIKDKPEYIQKYYDLLAQMAPSEENIEISYTAPDKYTPELTYTVTNNNVFPIYGFTAEYEFELMSVTEYSADFDSDEIISTKSEQINGFDSATYTVPFDIEDYCYSYVFHWYISSHEMYLYDIAITPPEE